MTEARDQLSSELPQAKEDAALLENAEKNLDNINREITKENEAAEENSLEQPLIELEQLKAVEKEQKALIENLEKSCEEQNQKINLLQEQIEAITLERDQLQEKIETLEVTATRDINTEESSSSEKEALQQELRSSTTT